VADVCAYAGTAAAEMARQSENKTIMADSIHCSASETPGPPEAY